MKSFILSNIFLLAVSAYAQDELNLSINVNAIKDIQLRNGELVNPEESNIDDLFLIQDNNLLVTPESGIKDIQLKSGGIIRIDSTLSRSPGPLNQGGDMGGGGK